MPEDSRREPSEEEIYVPLWKQDRHHSPKKTDFHFAAEGRGIHSPARLK